MIFKILTTEKRIKFPTKLKNIFATLSAHSRSTSVIRESPKFCIINNKHSYTVSFTLKMAQDRIRDRGTDHSHRPRADSSKCVVTEVDDAQLFIQSKCISQRTHTTSSNSILWHVNLLQCLHSLQYTTTTKMSHVTFGWSTFFHVLNPQANIGPFWLTQNFLWLAG